MELTAGQNMALPDPVGVRVTLSWPTHATVDADLSALLLRDDRVISSEHFVFYNQAASPDGAVRHVGKQSGTGTTSDSIDVGLAGLHSDVEVVVLAASAHPSAEGAMALLGQPEVTVTDPNGNVLARHRLASLNTESAINVLELYRCQGQWKVRAVGQGWRDGLAGLARDYGVDVDDDDDDETDGGPGPGEPDPAKAVDWSNPPVPAGYET